jgi:hypothetical protein
MGKIKRNTTKNKEKELQNNNKQHIEDTQKESTKNKEKDSVEQEDCNKNNKEKGDQKKDINTLDNIQHELQNAIGLVKSLESKYKEARYKEDEPKRLLFSYIIDNLLPEENRTKEKLHDELSTYGQEVFYKKDTLHNKLFMVAENLLSFIKLNKERIFKDN